MAYLGPKPSQTLATPTSQYFDGTGSQTVFTLNRAVNVSEDLEVFVNNIQQEPGVGKSYTASGTTLTFDAAPSSGTANVYVVYRGLAEVTTRLEHDANAALSATTGTFSGNVGIGETSPVTPLTITTENKLGSTFTGNINGEGLTVTQTNYTDGNYISLVEAAYDDSNDANPNVRIGAKFTGTGSSLAFGTSNNYGAGINNTAMTIDYEGKVGIGTASPSEVLEVYGTTPIIQINDRGLYQAQIGLIGNDTEFRGSSGNIEFYTGSADGASSTERMRILSDGKVAVGSTTSLEKLRVDGNIEVYNDDVDGYIWFHDTGTRSWSVGSDQSTGNFAITNVNGVASGHKLVIDSSGNVGIGDNNPSQKLSVNGNIKVDAGSTGYIQGPTGEMLVGEDGSGFYLGTGFGINPNIPFYYGNPSPSPTASHNFRGTTFNLNTTNATFALTSNASNVVFNNGVQCIFGSDGGSQLSLWADNSGPTHLAGYTFDIKTGPNNSRTLRGFYQDHTGTVTIGKSSGGPSGYTTAMNLRYAGGGAEYGIDFQPASNGANAATFWSAAGSVSGAINVGASSTLYNTSSDYRLKTTVTYDWDATSRLKQLKPARFEWIVDGDDAVPVDGFLAHEVQDIVPEAITGEKDAMRDEEYEVTPAVEATYDDEGNVLTEAVPAVMGTRSVPDYQGIDQSKLVPLLVKTIQELEARIAALEAN